MPLAFEFRSDINGLRAWAVLAVLFYHFKVPGFGGGYVGVDVFFVISGFLMGAIIVQGLERGQFSLCAFYWARARRLLPALVVLCALLLLYGWFFLGRDDYALLGRHVVASLEFRSNVQFSDEAGYFAQASHEKWLLHTWSLGAEFQFYLLVPVILWLAWRARPQRAVLVGVTSLLCAASLAYALLPGAGSAVDRFYLLPARAWEMLAGVLAFLLGGHARPSPVVRRTLEYSGALLLAGAICGFDAQTPWPGWRAAVPVLATTLLLLAERTESPWTGHAVAQWLGARSYSLYLWHWPLAVLLAMLEWQAVPLAVGAAIGCALLAAHLSYCWCELPARAWLRGLPVAAGPALVIAGATVVAVPGALIGQLVGLPRTLPAAAELASDEARNTNPGRRACFATQGVRSPSCVHGGDQLRVILVGDSHADAVSTALQAALPDGGAMLEWTYMSCPTMFGVRNLSPRFGPNERCGAFLDTMLGQLAGIAPGIPLVIVNRSTTYALGHNEPWEEDVNVPAVYFTKPYATAEPAFLAEFAERLTASACLLAQTRPVYLVRPIPEMGVDVPKVMARAALFGRARPVALSLADYHARHQLVWAAQNAARARCGVRILDPLPYLCGNGLCSGAIDGRPLYYDDDHLSEFGNKRLVPMFAPVFDQPGSAR